MKIEGGFPTRFSIIIPTYARPAQLMTCLQSLARLDYPRNRFEVIVVDDGGGVQSELIARFAHELNLSVVTQPNSGPGIARNTGARQARGEFFVFTDDDCEPLADYLKLLDERFAETPERMIGGRVVNRLEGNIYSAASQSLVDYLYLYYNSQPAEAVFFTSNNMAVPAGRFFDVGGFNPLFRSTAEDRELCDRWRYTYRHAMTYAPEVIVRHSHNLTLRSFWRQHFNYGRGALKFRTARAERQNARVKVEPMSFYVNLLLHPFTREASGARAIKLMTLMLLTQLANTAGYFYERLRRKRDS